MVCNEKKKKETCSASIKYTLSTHFSFLLLPPRVNCNKVVYILSRTKNARRPYPALQMGTGNVQDILFFTRHRKLSAEGSHRVHVTPVKYWKGAKMSSVKHARHFFFFIVLALSSVSTNMQSTHIMSQAFCIASCTLTLLAMTRHDLRASIYCTLACQINPPSRFHPT